MTYYIGSARHDENGKYTGGKAGDQTGQEVSTQKMYNYPSKGGWICYRFKDPYKAVAMRTAMLTACGNNHIGYSQSGRYGLMKYGIHTTTNTNTDCSILIRACIKEAADVDVGDFTTASEGTALMNSGLFDKVGKVTTASKLYEGDILVTAKKGHTAAVTTGLDRVASSKVESAKTAVALNRVYGVKYAQTFTGKTGLAANNKTRVLILQHAINLDYKAGLKEDGIFGNKTATALGSHYVKYGEKQYMVSAAEILVYLAGNDPKGYECPGKYGKGLKSATGKSKLDADWFVHMVK